MHSTADLWCIQCHVNPMTLHAQNKNNPLVHLFVGLCITEHGFVRATKVRRSPKRGSRTKALPARQEGRRVRKGPSDRRPCSRPCCERQSVTRAFRAADYHVTFTSRPLITRHGHQAQNPGAILSQRNVRSALPSPSC